MTTVWNEVARSALHLGNTLIATPAFSLWKVKGKRRTLKLVMWSCCSRVSNQDPVQGAAEACSSAGGPAVLCRGAGWKHRGHDGERRAGVFQLLTHLLLTKRLLGSYDNPHIPDPLCKSSLEWRTESSRGIQVRVQVSRCGGDSTEKKNLPLL